MTHRANCPVSRGADQSECECDALDLSWIAANARPSPAELIRTARSKGLIKAVPGYKDKATQAGPT